MIHETIVRKQLESNRELFEGKCVCGFTYYPTKWDDVINAERAHQTSPNEIVRLAYDDNGISTTTRAFLFRELLKLAYPRMTHYQSDLFHDALWINEIDGPTKFFFGVDETGTNIFGIDETDETGNREVLCRYRKNVWLINLRNVDGYWEIEITSIQHNTTK